MVIINYTAGQYSNRIIHFAHFIGNAVENNYDLFYPTFEEYAEYFDFNLPKNIKTQTNYFNNKTLNKFLFHLGRLQKKATYLNGCMPIEFLDIYENHDKKGVSYDINKKRFIKKCKQKIMICQGWLFRDEFNFNNHKELIVKIFTPKDEYVLKASKIIKDLNRSDQFIIGIHIRRGDYKEFCQGKYYYNDFQYLRIINCIENQVKANHNKSCQFLICSNEILSQSFLEKQNVYLSNNHFVVDSLLLASCDIIVGPPSTFSYWASFYGGKKLIHLEEPFLNQEQIKLIVE